MALITRGKLGFGLMLSSALVLAVGCSDDNGKGVPSFGEGGEGGAMPGGPSGDTAGVASTAAAAGAAGDASFGPGEGGNGPGPAAGAAGDGTSGAAGADSSAAGSSGTTGDGDGPLACVAEGSLTNAEFPVEPSYKVCRGAILVAPFTADALDEEFTCCAAPDGTAPGFGLSVSGYDDGNGDGQFALHIPENAPLGPQTLAVNCASGPVANNLALEVTDTAAPVLDGASASIHPGEPIVLHGLNLTHVTDVAAIGPTGVNYECVIDPESSDDETITCDLPLDIPVSADDTVYNVVAYEQDCGFAFEAPEFVVTPNP